MLIDCATLFQINPDCNISVRDIFGQKVLIIDDVLTKESFDKLDEASDNFPRTLFLDNHYNPNGKTYIDARTTLECKQNYTYNNFIIRQISDNYQVYVSWFNWIVVNYAKVIKPKPNMIGNIPHEDITDYASILYFDNCEGNGTGFYTTKTGISMVHNQALSVLTTNNGYVPNTNDYFFTKDDFEMFYESTEFVSARKNRMILYSGKLIHGAVHNELMFNDDYRKTMVTFHTVI